jgi:hypothetical protein
VASKPVTDNPQTTNELDMPKIVLAAAAVAAMLAGAGTASADPSPPPSPGYQILTPDGPQFPGNQIYPPRCAHNMYGCGFRYDPGSGTWTPPGTDPP